MEYSISNNIFGRINLSSFVSLFEH